MIFELYFILNNKMIKSYTLNNNNIINIIYYINQ